MIIRFLLFIYVVTLLMQIEREVILSSADKNSKIPILHEYKKQRPKSASATAIAPEGPNKQLAWVENKKTAISTSVSAQKASFILYVIKTEASILVVIKREAGVTALLWL
jgi:hypothetical protein